EAIPGFQTSISKEQFMNQVNEIGLSIVGQTANLAPADKKIYALRDVTATVDNVSLIAASIMSKKLAAGADGIVLDVKCGTGAFMKTLDDARMLAKTMVAIGTMAGKKTVALITDMNEPLGNCVGNILEVKEAIDCLKGNGEKRLMDVSKALACEMLILAGKANQQSDAFRMIEETIHNGNALNKLKEFVKAQGGDTSVIDDPTKFKEATIRKVIYGKDLLNGALEGYLCTCNNQEIGMTSLVLGGGRETKESEIDLTVGIVLEKHLGDYISSNDIVATLYGNDEGRVQNAVNRFITAYQVSHEKVKLNPIVYEIITDKDMK
ncbi:MAG: thymidine phosphorylase, partial [Lachnospiraceae bacterium]